MAIADWIKSPGVPSVQGLIQQFTGVAALYWNDPAGIALLAQQLGAINAPLYIWDTLSDPVNIAAMIVADEMYVWCDGTQTVIPQAVGDILGTLAIRYEGSEQLVQSYFYTCAQQLLNWLLTYTIRPRDLRRITLSGHSYGAAACGVLQDLLMGIGCVRPDVCLFAAPRWFAEPLTVARNYGYVLNMHGQADVIPYMPGELVEGFLPIALGQLIAHGAVLEWRDYTQHWGYGDSGPVAMSNVAPGGLLSLNPLVWGPQHTAAYHIEQLAAWYQRELGDPQTSPFLSYMLSLLARPVPSTPPPRLNNLDGPQIAELQTIYFPQPTDPRITVDNYLLIGQNAVEQVSPDVAASSIIPAASVHHFGASDMPLTGYKCTAFWGVGEWGWSHTFYTQQTALADVETSFNALMGSLRLCMGWDANPGGGGGSGPSSVSLDYMRYQPLSGLGAPTLRGPLSLYNPLVLPSTGFGSNMPAVCLFNSLTVSTVISGQNVKGTRQFFLHGTPDIIIEGLKYKPSGSAVINSNLQQFYALLQASASPWTMMVQNPTAANGYIQGGSISGGRWVLQYLTSVPGSNPLAVGDRIRLRRSNPSTFDGSWVVAALNTAVTPNLLTLASGPPTGTADLKNAEWIKTYDRATKSPEKQHVSYNSNAQWKVLAADTTNYLCRQHKVGGRFRPTRGSKRRKRQTI